ncbi:bifunctional non-homologous end joining protein LigD [Saccharopolyspora shandongensis]|uniref:Bifunctional non-homologous end joining protein LigD n=1 Tax=Saccharopolyspora shandongensis TaxID=418495 RepID=A0A1H3JPQ6_9PSEU|nr:non-homologous end-joining DNA ligase [Saccharopolyspora shandongensis]SDY41515.1 bifunctional non-homologous end joining protein LigD [Saccharopolyspora shandongensis]
MTARVEVEGRRIELSNPDKVLYPDDGYRKRDVAEYFRSVAAVLVAHARGKPMTLRRFPDGIGSAGFFQKEASNHFPDWVRVAAVPQRGAPGAVHHVVVDDAATLLYLAGQACLEFHIGLSTVDDLDLPVLAVLDLDPPDGVELSELRDVVRLGCERFRDAGLSPHVQATGGRGFHIAAPLRGDRGFDEVRAAIRELAEAMARDEPDRLTVEQRKDKRGDRIFLDTNRNAYGQTMIAPYSLRARPGAPAATPFDLDELGRVTPQSYGLANMARRLAQKDDPWADLEDARSGSDFPHPGKPG